MHIARAGMDPWSSSDVAPTRYHPYGLHSDVAEEVCQGCATKDYADPRTTPDGTALLRVSVLATTKYNTLVAYEHRCDVAMQR